MGGRNFSLTPHLSGFVDRQVGSGRHQNASEVVREALRRYEDDLAADQAGLVALERLAEMGTAAIARGDYRLVSGADDARALLADLEQRAAERS